MSDHSAIEWTDASWNPIRARNTFTGKIGWHCTHASEGCRFCYAEGFNRRLGTGEAYVPGALVERDGLVEVFLDEKMLLAPLRWKKPRMIFVGSMTDLFADFVKDVWLDKMFAVMALCPQHTFQVLTKRAERMLAYMTHGGPTLQTLAQVPQVGRGVMTANTDWPLPNVWLGVSAERQEEADERIPLLLQTPAAVRFVSAEPLLGPIDLTCIQTDEESLDVVRGQGSHHSWAKSIPITKLDWVITGGESGSRARPMNPQWARDIRDQCAAAGVAFFHKQNGEFASVSEVEGEGAHFYFPDGRTVRRVGKKAAGRLLDGVEHSAFPQAAP